MEGTGNKRGTKQIRDRICFVLITIVTIAAMGVFISTVWGAFHPAAEGDLSPSMITQQITPPDFSTTTGIVPSKLTIASLGVSADVQKLGINAKGNIASPSSFSAAGWYRYGPRPGDSGIAIIDGYVNNGLSLAGVFVHLDQIKVGDEIAVSDNEGKQLRFMVTNISKVPYTARLNDLLSSQSNRHQLALITCDGTWISSQKTYDQRIVVLADEMPIR